MRKRRITLHILLYICFFILSTALAVAILYWNGMSLLAPVCCGWLLIALFCYWKIHTHLRFRRTYRKGTWTIHDLDDIDGLDFEELTCDILVANGFDIAENTQASVDFGVDVLARKDEVTYAIQCKRYQKPVGVEAVQQVYAGRAYYECHVAVVLTNQYYTSHARRLADKLGVVLWDRDMLEEML